MKTRLIGPALILVLAACAASTVNPVIVPLQYKTMATTPEFPTAQSCAKISRIDVTDNRTAQTIGTRSLQEKPSQRADVTTSGDVAEWIRSGAQAALHQANLSMTGGGPALRIGVDNIKTDESVYHRAQYNGRVALTTELVSPSGHSCWRGQVEGASENYGYAGSPENYQETLNHALDRAMIRLLESSDFKNAVCNCS